MDPIDEVYDWLDRRANDRYAVIRVDLVRELVEELDGMPVLWRHSMPQTALSHEQVLTAHDAALQQLTDDAEDMGMYEAPSGNQVSTNPAEEPNRATREELVDTLRETLERAVDQGVLDDEIRHRIRDILSREEA